MFHNKRKIFQKNLLLIAVLFKIHVICCSVNILSYQNGNNKSIVDHYNLRNFSINISEELIRATYIELGVTTMQKIYDSFKFVSVVQHEEKLIERISNKLHKKLIHALDILNQSKSAIENQSLTQIGLPISSEIYPCPQAVSNWNSDSYHEKEIKYEKNNYVVNNETYYLQKVFIDQFSNITDTGLGVKQFYFLSTLDLKKDSLINNFKCQNYDNTHMWQLYISLMELKPKLIYIAFDHGNSLSNQQLDIQKTIGKEVISMLRDEDHVGLISFSDKCLSPYLRDDLCQVPNQTPISTGDCRTVHASLQNKKILNKFINSLKIKNCTSNHTMVFETLLNSMFTNNEENSSESVMILYISHGIVSSFTEARSVMESVANLQKSLSFPALINVITVTDDSEPYLSENFLLNDIVKNNFEKYDLDADYEESTKIGLFQSVNSTISLGLAIARIFYTLNSTHKNNLNTSLSLPQWHGNSKELMVSLSVPCGRYGELGLLALNMYFSDIAEDVTYYSSKQKYTYAFLLDSTGLTLMHPSFPRPIVTSEQPIYVDIIHLEKMENFTIIREMMLHEENGVYKYTVGNETIKYVWKHVLNWYIICFVVQENSVATTKLHKVTFADTSVHSALLHHRLDLLPPPTLCKHLKQVATLDAGTLFLSASCFQSPFMYLRGEAGMLVSPLTLQSYMAFIKDNTRLLANPGLKDEVRNDVTVLSHILNYLMRQHLHGKLNKYIVRRYVATVNGVLQMYPGCILDVDLEPTRRSWFTRAVEHAGSIVLTSPYLDAGGAGYIVTISHSIYEGNPSGQHSTNNSVVAVMAMDVTFGYIYKMLLQNMPVCIKKNIKCFIIDDGGYLIYHPSLIIPNGKGPVEKQHIIHKESLVANDILNHKHFVKKILCNNYANGTIQRYYKFNTSLTKVLTNVVNGEHCVRYYISAVPRTNVFVGIINFTCDDITTFCPCSTVDRLCLICNRMEQNECECPCECPLNLNGQNCTHSNKSLLDNQICAPAIEQSHLSTNSPFSSMASGLKPCLPFLCEIHTSYESCLGVLGCEWCQIDVDGETALQNPFCTSLTTCFNGVLGSISPYRNTNIEALSSQDLFVSAYSSIGPVASSIVVLCFILALMFYCYRQYSIQSMDRLYMGSAPEPAQGVRMSSIDVNDDFNDEFCSHQHKLLQKSPNNVGPISPYCITTGYRKPVSAVDSDHGYSTMTPHEESERLSFALIELDSLEDDLNNSDSMSTNTSISNSKLKMDPKKGTPKNDASMTYLNNKHCILAPVTVHRNMETL